MAHQSVFSLPLRLPLLPIRIRSMMSTTYVKYTNSPIVMVKMPAVVYHIVSCTLQCNISKQKRPESLRNKQINTKLHKLAAQQLSHCAGVKSSPQAAGVSANASNTLLRHNLRIASLSDASSETIGGRYRSATRPHWLTHEPTGYLCLKSKKSKQRTCGGQRGEL